MSTSDQPPIEVTAAVFFNEGSVLSFRRKPGMSLAGFWEFPGGKLERNETLISCLNRELIEELDVQIVSSEYLGACLHHSAGKSIKLHGYVVSRWAGEFRLTDHDQMRWLGAESIDSVAWSPADLFFCRENEATPDQDASPR